MPTPSLNIQKEITLNLDKPNDLVIFKAKQYDALSRNIKINLLFNDAPWVLPGSIRISSSPLSSSYIYAMVRYKKPDGTCGMYDTDEEDNQAVTGTSGNSYITVRLAEQILVVEGKVTTEINFYNADGQKLTAFSFIIDVEKSSISDEQYVSSDYYNLLRHDIAAIYQVNEAFASAAQAAISGTLTIDDTLSIHGAIADAKAAGDMIQMKETQPSETSNILWIKEPEEEIEIPTMEDIETLQTIVFELTFTASPQNLYINYNIKQGDIFSFSIEGENFPADGTHMFNIYVTGASSTVTNLVTGRKGLFTSPIDGNWFTVYNRNTGWTGTVIIKMQKLVIAVADDFRNRLDFKYLAAGPSKMINNSSTLSDATNGTNSLNDLQVNRIYTIGAYPIGVLDAPKENATGTIVSFYYHPDTTYNGRPSNNDGLAQIFIGSNFIASRWRVTGSWTNWLIYDKSNALSIHPHSNSILSSSDLSKVTDETNNADLFPINKIIFIESESLSIENAASIDSLGHAKSGIYITIKGTPSEIQNVSGCTQIFIGADEIAYRFKAGSTWGAWIFSEKAATEYYVGPTRNHTSLTSLLLDLSGDQSKKIIHIDDGEYDIFSEYVSEIQDSRHRITIPPDDITAADYFGTYNAFVPNNTKIIGHGNVILKFTPTVAQLESLSDDANHTGYGASRTWSPLNIYGSVEIENLTVVCHNCRYCLHNDDHNHYQKSYQYYKNIRFLYTYSDLNTANLRLGFNNTIGFGIQEGSTHVFEDCEIYMDTTTNSGVYYGHESANAKNGRLILKNCRIHSSNFSNTSVIRLQSLATSSGNVEALFENCYINGGLRLEMYYTTSPQNFSVTFVNCNKVPVTRRIASGGIIVDDKTVTWYNPLPTPTVDNPLIETDQYSS